MNKRMNVERMVFSIICPLALASILSELGIPVAVCLTWSCVSAQYRFSTLPQHHGLQ